MSDRELGLHAYPAAAKGRGEALLFVHGAYTNSSCWSYKFIPYFRGLGYDCFALDLSGHGTSGGHHRLHGFGLDDYAEDLSRAMRQLGRSATVVAHSMGTLVLERFLAQGGDARAAVLLAPVPSTGTGGSALQLALREPGFFGAIDDVLNQRFTPEVVGLMTRVYFSPRMSAADTLKFLPMIGPESDRAVTEMALLQLHPLRRRRLLPTLVMGGECDAVFPASMLHFTSSAWGGQFHRVPHAGHMLMLDPEWEETAEYLHGWLERRAGRATLSEHSPTGSVPAELYQLGAGVLAGAGGGGGIQAPEAP